MKMKHLWLTVAAVATFGSLASCSSDIDFVMPPSPKGDPGISAYEAWKIEVADGKISWPKGEVAVVDFFKYLKGEDGRDGANGVNGMDGKSAYEVWVASIATGIVPNPHKPSELWPATNNTLSAFWYFLSGGTGEMGKTPYVGENGNWYIDGVDTGLPSRGQKGDKAEAPTIYISDRNTWVINGYDTGANARGIDGKNGKNGKDVTVELDPNGNFFFNGIDTHIPWRGQAGKDGAAGKNVKITISDHGTWVIDGVDTNKPVQGRDGQSNRVGINASGNWTVNGADTGKPARGADGKNFTIAIQNGTWWVNGVDTHSPAVGVKGDRGANGLSPKVEISADGFWVINGVKTSQTALAKDGQPVEVSIANGVWVINGQPTTMPALGVNGRSPEMYVGSNKNWWVRIGGVNTDTGSPSIGRDGTPAPAPTITIGTNGNWVINGVDTGVRAKGNTGAQGAQGANGRNGVDGKSAYELWKIQVATGTLVDPHDSTSYWPTTHTSVNDFWQYLRGADGKDGKDGADGEDGKPGIAVEIGKANVLPIYFNGKNREYVDPATGEVTMEVYDATGAKVGAGATVQGLPGMTPSKTYTTDANGRFKIPAVDLPNRTDGTVASGKPATITINGAVVEGSERTLVPNRVNVRLSAEMVYFNQVSVTDVGYMSYGYGHYVNVKYLYERQVNGVWSAYPSTYATPVLRVVRVVNPSQAITPGNIIDNADVNKHGTPLEGPNFRIIRPVVIPPSQDVPDTQINPAFASRAIYRDGTQFKWNNQDNYYTLRGVSYFYGQQPLLPEAIHAPEIYNAMPIKDVKYSIISGTAVLWGKMDLSQPNPYYYDFNKTTVSGNTVWKSTRLNGNTIFTHPILKNMYTSLFITASGSGTGGFSSTSKPIGPTHITTREQAINLVSAYPTNTLGVGAYKRDVDTVDGKTRHYAPYRIWPQYILTQSGSNYVLRNPYKVANEDIVLTIETMPSTWPNQ